MSTWASVMAGLSPDIWWRLDETSGTAAVDSSTNSRDGTYQNAPTLNQASLVTNQPSSPSVTLNGVNQHVKRNNEAWMNSVRDFSIGCVCKPSVLPGADGNRRELVGMVGLIQVWTGYAANGKITGWIQVGGVNHNIDSIANMASGTTYYVVFTYDGANMKIYINGALDNTVAQIGSSINHNTSFGFYAGHASTDLSDNTFWKGGMDEAFFFSRALSSTEVTNLYNAGIATPNSPPTAPGAITIPTAGQSVDTTVTVTWGAATDPDSDPIQYRGEYSSNNGSSWSTLFALQSGTTYVWNTSGLTETTTYKVRVLASDGASESGWTTSSAFTIHHNVAPNSPPSITAPANGATFDGTITVTWTASTDPEGDAITYFGQISTDNGSTWSDLFTWQSALTATVDISAIHYSTTCKVRVKARDVHNAESAYTTSSNVFTIQHVSTPPTAPVLVAQAITDYSVLLRITSSFADVDAGFEGAHYATQWQLDLASGNYSTPKFDSGFSTTHLFQQWITGLEQHKDLKARARFIDEGGQTGDWKEITFTSHRIITLGSSAGFDQNRNEGTDATIQGVYGELIAGTGFVPAHYPELLASLKQDSLAGDYGIRLRSANTLGNYSQGSVPTSQSQVIKYVGAGLVPADINSGPVTLLLVLRPEHVLDLPFEDVTQGAYEVVGSEGDSWWLYQRNGVFQYGPPVFSGGGWRGPFQGGSIVSDVPVLIILTYTAETANPVCQDNDVTDADRVLTPGTEIFWMNGVRYAKGHLRGDGSMLDSYNGGCPAGERKYVPSNLYFGTASNTLWLGRHSGSGNRNFDNSANGVPYAGIISEFAWWPNRLMSEAEAASLYDAFSNNHMTTFANRVKALSPVIYDRFQQPAPPNKPVVSKV